jgi:hypothetical protein
MLVTFNVTDKGGAGGGVVTGTIAGAAASATGLSALPPQPASNAQPHRPRENLFKATVSFFS